jgi:D-alanyl-lipoteichoic acid acyltransferase DltB (MBOAT superfamily)
MLPQISDPKTYIFQWRNLSLGTVLFVIGLAKKVLIADHFIVAAADTFNSAHDLKLVNAWSGILSYSLQLYFDFSGYSDMAIGMALMFGLRFPANFNSPYRATSIINFWQRWHMTLTRYLTLYLYNPAALWVSRRRAQKGKSIGKKAISTPEGFLNLLALPTFYTMLLAGVWHGAGLQFIIFGLLHGLYLTVNHAWRSFGPRVPEGPSHVAARFLSTVGKVALTYLAVLVAQVFFRATSMHNALDLLAAMAGFHGVTDPSVTLHEMLSQSLLLVALYFVVWMMPNSLQLLDRFTPTLSDLRFDSPIHFSWNPNLVWGVAIGVLACVALLGATGITEFIYFRF